MSGRSRSRLPRQEAMGVKERFRARERFNAHDKCLDAILFRRDDSYRRSSADLPGAGARRAGWIQQPLPPWSHGGDIGSPEDDFAHRLHPERPSAARRLPASNTCRRVTKRTRVLAVRREARQRRLVARAAT
jgi:hypothetical protein